MKDAQKQPMGFTLVEVVLAIGVVSFALLAIFGLFSTSLQNDAQVVDEVEALSATKALPAFLKAQGFVTVYTWLEQSSNPSPVGSGSTAASPPLLYAYDLPAVSGATSSNEAGQSFITLSPPPTTGTTAVTNRQGRLFGIYLTVSPNMPIGSVAIPTSSTLAGYSPTPPPSGAGGYPEGALAVQVKVFAVSQVGIAPESGAFPILTYDIAVQH
jgi:type II secretory pathway pseudopilin PulG